MRRTASCPILAVAGDPGGAAALAPALQLLQEDGAAIQTFAYRQALEIWGNAGLAPICLPESATDEPHLPEEASLVITATSVNGIDWETRFWRAARRRGMHSLAVLDYWSNLRSRFLLDGELIVPDRIAVMDETARDGLATAGLPMENLAITGQPAFDALASLAGRGEEIRQRLRAEYGIADDASLVVFASQPFSVLRHQPGFIDPGYDENTTLKLLVPALAGLAAKHGRHFHLVIRPHPREDESALMQRWSYPRLSIEVLRQGNGREWALAADLVCGMQTVLLQEACYLERPVLSLQPGLRGNDSLPANRQGLSYLVTEPHSLDSALEKLLFDPCTRVAYSQRQREARPKGDAARQVADLAWTLLKNDGSQAACQEKSMNPSTATPESSSA